MIPVRPLGALALLMIGLVATLLFVLVDVRSDIYGVLGIIILAFVVAYAAFWILRFLLTKPVPRPPTKRPDQRTLNLQRWMFGSPSGLFDPLNPDLAPRAPWYGRRVWRWKKLPNRALPGGQSPSDRP